MKKASESENYHHTMDDWTNQPAIGDKSHEKSSDQTLLGLDHRRNQKVGSAAQKLEDEETER